MIIFDFIMSILSEEFTSSSSSFRSKMKGKKCMKRLDYLLDADAKPFFFRVFLQIHFLLRQFGMYVCIKTLCSVPNKSFFTLLCSIWKVCEDSLKIDLRCLLHITKTTFPQKLFSYCSC